MLNGPSQAASPSATGRSQASRARSSSAAKRPSTCSSSSPGRWRSASWRSSVSFGFPARACLPAPTTHGCRARAGAQLRVPTNHCAAPCVRFLRRAQCMWFDVFVVVVLNGKWQGCTGFGSAAFRETCGSTRARSPPSCPTSTRERVPTGWLSKVFTVRRRRPSTRT